MATKHRRKTTQTSASYGTDVPPPADKPKREKVGASVAAFLTKHGCERLFDDPEAARLLRRYLRLNEEAKALFAKSDILMGKLLRTLGPGKPVKIGRSRVAIVVDQFAEKLVVWKATASRRYVVTTFGEEG